MRRRGRRLRAGLRWTSVLALVLVAARVLWCGYGPHEPDVAAQVRFVGAAVDGGAGEQMQQLFPEGDLFMQVLHGLAVPADDALTRAEQVELMGHRLERLHDPAVTAPFAGSAGTEDGIFAHGWTLLLEVERARLSGAPAHRAAVREQAEVVRDALGGAPSGFLESYPGRTWPVDNVVAAAALRRADRLVGVDDAAGTLDRWIGRVERSRDPATGLLPHEVDAAGTALDGPRATSQSLIQLFWPEIDPTSAAAQWRTYRATFLDRRAGLVGVREHPHGDGSGGDVDSGPLVLGVSLSASTVTLAAARAHGDEVLAQDLSREAELLGLPLQLGDERRYAAGAIPVGDAFLAWARTTPTATPEPPGEQAGEGVGDEGPRPWWWLWAAVPLVLAGVTALAPRISRRGTVRSS